MTHISMSLHSDMIGKMLLLCALTNDILQSNFPDESHSARLRTIQKGIQAHSSAWDLNI